MGAHGTKQLVVITANGIPQGIVWAGSLEGAIRAMEADVGLGHPEGDPVQVREDIVEKRGDWSWYMYDSLAEAKAEWAEWGGLDQWMLAEDGSDIEIAP